ncbi:hypothetical protein IIA28_17895 [candidate division KSB1 bacterium]|nr:hypothetical protein [candidate division KSB1 bacterium]
MVEKHLPIWLSAAGLAAILAAVMSSLDGQILTISTMVAGDIFGRKEHKAAPKVGRAVVIVLALAAFVVSLFRPAGIFDISVYAFSGYTLIVPVMAFGLFWKRSTAAGVLVGSIVGHGLLAAYYLGFKFSTLGTFPVLWCLIIESVVIVLVSLVTSPPPNEVVTRFDNPFGR